MKQCPIGTFNRWLGRNLKKYGWESYRTLQEEEEENVQNTGTDAAGCRTGETSVGKGRTLTVPGRVILSTHTHTHTHTHARARACVCVCVFPTGKK